MSVGEAVLLELFRRFPPKENIFKDPGDRAAQEYAAEDDADRFLNHFDRQYSDMFSGADVLDLGSGFGGRTVRFLEYGARSVVGLEVTPEHVERGREFAERRDVTDRVSFVLGTGEAIPCPDESFDLVAMMDVMEHVIDPPAVLREIHRVLRPGGLLATTFPPYFDLTQGSHLHGYATRLPGLNLLFPTRTLRSATKRHVTERGVDFDRFFRDVPTDKLWNQNGLTVRRWNQVVAGSPLVPEWTHLMGHLQFRRVSETGSLNGPAPLKYRVAQQAAEAPVLRELTCSRICAVLRKDPTPLRGGSA